MSAPPGPPGRDGLPPGRGAALVAGIACAAAPWVLPPPEGLDPLAWRAAGLGLMMALWWVAEVIPLAATALVPLAVFPLAGLAPLDEVARSYAHPLVILFLGGFLLARAVERWGLHLALAHRILALTGGGPARTVGGLMLATAFLSLWISNTASTMIMAPIGAAAARAATGDDRVAAATLLGIAYAATIGGMGSLIGTPPNALFAAYMQEAHGIVLGFVEWAMVGLPVVAILLPLTWLLLTRVVFPLPSGALEAGPPEAARAGTAARRVAVVAGLTALAWVLRPLLERLAPGTGITDAGIAMAGALALFLLPSGERGRLLDWETAKGLRWDVLILFGGGLALARVIDRTGLADWLAGQAAALEGLAVPLLLLGFAAMIVLVGELASNTAMAAIFLPIAGATALGLGVDPLAFTLPVALAASVGFMLPVATPPNAIVFAYPAVTRARMLRAGAALDVIGTVVAVGVAWLLAPLVLGG
jgi:sodium-dependent dicarboxylate transporter 2/3/5